MWNPPLESSALPTFWPSSSHDLACSFLLSMFCPAFLVVSSVLVGTNYLYHRYQKQKYPLHFFLKQIFLCVCLLYVSYYFRGIKYSKRSKQEISVLKEHRASWGRHLVFSVSMSQTPGHILSCNAGNAGIYRAAGKVQSTRQSFQNKPALSFMAVDCCTHYSVLILVSSEFSGCHFLF